MGEEKEICRTDPSEQIFVAVVMQRA